jgi:magnesium transporter
MNRIMKQLSIVSTIALPLIVIGGIYGMNFSHLPLTDNPLGFWLTLVLMGGVSAALVFWLKRQRWF